MSFIAALDQSGGSTPAALLRYGCEFTADTAADKMHEFRLRIINSPAFNNNNIDSAILFRETVSRGGVELLREAGIDSYLKIDQGLEEDGTMKPFDLTEAIAYAKQTGCVGTKMRSFIVDISCIRKVLNQQFLFASKIFDAGLIPIVEPEVSIHATEKTHIESALADMIGTYTFGDTKHECILKLTLPDTPNLYAPLQKHLSVKRLVALSGGYPLPQATAKLAQNASMSASFSRALTDGLKYKMSDSEFDQRLQSNIASISEASE